jgi:hypothetical protein
MVELWRFVVLAPLLLGCDGSLLSGTELDRPAFHVSGVITGSALGGIAEPLAEPLAANQNLSFGILWIDPAQEGSGNSESGSELLLSRLDPQGQYTIDFLEAPPEHAVRWLSSSDGSVFALAFGEFVLFEDGDRDGRFRVGPVAEGSPMAAPDRYRGAAVQHVLLYVAQPLKTSEVPISALSGISSTQGYQLGNIDCYRPESPIVTRAGDVRVPIQMTEGSSSFPELRPCFRSHPSSAP